MSDLRPKIPGIVEFIEKERGDVRRLGSEYIVARMGANNVTVSGTSTATSTTISGNITPVYLISVAIIDPKGAVVDKVAIGPGDKEFRSLRNLLVHVGPTTADKDKAHKDLDVVIASSQKAN
jgi:hypothetical protein